MSLYNQLQRAMAAATMNKITNIAYQIQSPMSEEGRWIDDIHGLHIILLIHPNHLYFHSGEYYSLMLLPQGGKQ